MPPGPHAAVPAPKVQNIHATCVELVCSNMRCGVLLLGPPGSGKSSLALRLVDEPGYGAGGSGLLTARLVADDQSIACAEDNRLLVSAPAMIAGLLEVRGTGIFKLPGKEHETAFAEFVVQHSPGPGAERLPPSSQICICGVDLPLYHCDFASPFAPAVVRLLVQVQCGDVEIRL